jgi:hypothetical protein
VGVPRVNLWHDWGSGVNTHFWERSDSSDREATGMEFVGRVTVLLSPHFSIQALASYRFAVGNTDGGRRQGVQGDLGLRFVW